LQAQVTDNLVKGHDVLNVGPFSISVFNGSIEIKIPYYHPVLIIWDLKVVQLVGEVLPLLSMVWAINHSEFPLF
jgi:hypothetical protein